MTTSDDTSERHVRPFAEFLIEQRRGALANELSEGLNHLVEQVNMTGKKGTLSLTITVSPESDINVSVSDKVVVKVPESDRPKTIWFVDDDRNLTRTNPYQGTLPLSVVPDAAPAKEHTL